MVSLYRKRYIAFTEYLLEYQNQTSLSFKYINPVFKQLLFKECVCLLRALGKSQQTFSVNGQTVNILGFAALTTLPL